MKLKVGFVGLGAMGGPMAKRVLEAGFELSVWNRNVERTRDIVERGATLAKDPAALAESSDVVMSCLLGSDAIEEVYRGKRGLLAGAHEGLILVEHGTFNPEFAKSLGNEAAMLGASFVDAPVSGGSSAANAGTLVTMVGGDAAAEASVREVAGAYASSIEWLGPVGSGLMLKLVNQMLVTAHVAAACEAAALVQLLPIDPAAATRALNHGWASSAMLSRCLPIAFTQDLTAGSDANLGGLREAQHLVLQMAEQTGVAVPVFDRAVTRFDQARENGWGGRDLAALTGLNAPVSEGSG